MSMKQVKKANEEQTRAIYHSGGKILSAGAGSGKTFVLVEHIVFLLLELKGTLKKEEWDSNVPKKLGQIVLMTFTKKAAGEISVRLLKKIEELIEVDFDNSEFWKIVQLNLTHINVTTIHGFCHKLLGQGFWSDLPSEFNLVSDIEFKNKILNLFDRWLDKRQAQLPMVFQASANSLGSAMVEIFSSPELKMMWDSPIRNVTVEGEINAFFEELLKVEGLESLFLDEIDLIASDKEKKKKWFEVISEFSDLRKSLGKISSTNFQSYNDYFLSITRFPVLNSAEISQSQKKSLGDIKNLREILKKTNEDLTTLKEHFPIYQQWVMIIQEIYDFIKLNYLEINGFTFSDLEYFVLKGLENIQVLEKIRSDYTYFIIDEFQDTSFIQFDIVKKLVGDNLERLFTVGDRKQAIYGFRGGELQVFTECSKLFGDNNNLLLKKNFRSFGNVINYNNALFAKVLKLGAEFEGVDPHGIEMEAQEIPLEELKDKGIVKSLKTVINANPKDINLDIVESERLFQEIQRLLGQDEYQTICILYRKLRPSYYLLEKLQELSANFTAQIKIEISEDPIMRFFQLMIERELNASNPKKLNSTLFLLKTLAEVIGIIEPLEPLIEQFSQDCKLYGISFSFHKMMFSLGISNSHAIYNSDLIDAICALSSDNLENIFQLLSVEGEKDYSCEVIQGSGRAKRIYIMSAHASKGLEFDAVLLGGIHTNGRAMGMKEMIGKIPHSFRWKKSFDQKKFYKSPFYFLESELTGKKDFSESKRLLYVACTRAIKYLGYVDLHSHFNGDTEELFENKNSWIQALRLHPGQVEESTLESHESNYVQRPLIQKDSLGIEIRNEHRKLGVISELSVTRLACLAECPFKFYLKNICKIEVEKSKQSFLKSEEDDRDFFYSSMERGTKLHGQLSDLFTGKIQVTDLAKTEKETLLWAYELGKTFLDKHLIISEKLIKFSLFGQMISGTPDIVFLNKEDSLIVWDFKTGKRDEQKESHYWLQLFCYAYAYSQKMHLSQEREVEVALVYLDEKNLVSRKYSVKEITQLLFFEWSKTESLNQVNYSHCSNCEYNKICQKAKSHL